MDLRDHPNSTEARPSVTFFPNTAFAWAFCVGLILLTGIAAWTDTRRAKIPNRLTVLILVLGLVVNTVRGAWLAAEGKPVSLWPLENTHSVWGGALYGFLFAVMGFAVAFAIMFLIWIFGSCGGGDVKLMSSVAAWLGISGFLFSWLGSVVVLFFWMLARMITGGLSPRRVKKSLSKLHEQKTAYEGGKAAPRTKAGSVRMTYSLPLAIAVALILVFVYRFELQLAPPKPQPAQQVGASAHGPPTFQG